MTVSPMAQAGLHALLQRLWRCVVQTSNSGRQRVLLPPASWRPTTWTILEQDGPNHRGFAPRITQGGGAPPPCESRRGGAGGGRAVGLSCF